MLIGLLIGTFIGVNIGVGLMCVLIMGKADKTYGDDE